MPLNNSQDHHESRVSFEAKSRGHSAIVTSGLDGIRFLDIDFSDREAHDLFARWVMINVFGASEETTFDITWG